MSRFLPFRAAAAAGLALLAGCAAQSTSSDSEAWPEIRTPSVAPDEVLVLPKEALARLWTVKKWPVRAMIQAMSKRAKQGCAAVAYVIERDGSTSGHRVLRAFPEVLGLPALRASSQWRYEPTAANLERSPVYTYETVSVGPSADADFHAKLVQPCAVESLLAEDLLKADR